MDKERRRQLVADGRCSQCGKRRKNFRSMCDGCAQKHRERQRNRYPKMVSAEESARRLQRDKLLAYLKRERGME